MPRNGNSYGEMLYAVNVMKFTFESMIVAQRKACAPGKENGILISGPRKELIPFIGKKVIVTVEEVIETVIEPLKTPPLVEPRVKLISDVIWPE